MGIRVFAGRARRTDKAATGQQRKSGLVGRRRADIASAIVFVVIFVATEIIEATPAATA